MQPTYRAAVARKTKLKPPTVTGIVNELLKQQLLLETPVPADVGPRGGRPPQMLRLNADARHILGIDLEPDVLRLVRTNMLVEVLEYREQPIDRFSEPQAIFDQMFELCRQVLGKTPSERCLGAGVSLPGLIDRADGTLISSTNMPEWHNVPVGQILSRELGMPVRIERSIHLAAFHEQWCEPRHQYRNTLVVSLRTGIGASLLHHGEPYLGSRGFAGEIGHTVVDINGKRCECGNQGCLETLVSASAICGRARERMECGKCAALRERLEHGERLRPELIYRLAKAGDRDCADIVRDVGRYIGIAVSNMLNLLAPDDVVICGSIDTADELILEAVQSEIRKSALPRICENVRVRLAGAKERAPVLGAAVLVARQLFELPKLNHRTAGETERRGLVP